MASVGSILIGAAAGGWPAIILTLINAVMWGSMIWDVYEFIKSEFNKEMEKAGKKVDTIFKSNKIRFEDDTKFIEAVKEDKYASTLFESHWFGDDKVNLNAENLYEFYKKGGNLEILSNIYTKAQKFNRLEDKDDSLYYQAFSNLYKSHRFKKNMDEDEFEKLINNEIKRIKEQERKHKEIQESQVQHQTKIEEHNKKLSEKIEQQTNVTTQGLATLAEQLSILNRQLAILINVEQTQTMTLQEITIPKLD